MTMSSKIYFNTRRFSPSKLLLGLGTRLYHVLAPTHAKRTASKLLLTLQRATRASQPRLAWSSRPSTPVKGP